MIPAMVPDVAVLSRSERAEQDVQTQMAKLRGVAYDVDAAAAESEALVTRQLRREGFTQEELVELDKRIGNSTFSDIAVRAEQQQKDVALLMLALSVKCDDLGEEFAKIQTLSPEERARLQVFVDKLAEAKKNLVAAESSMKFWRKSRVQSAKKAIADAEHELDLMQEEVNAAARARRRTSDLESSFQGYSAQVGEVKSILERHLVDVIDSRIKTTKEKLADTYSQRNDSSERFKTAEAEMQQAEKDLEAARLDLAQYDRIVDMVAYSKADEHVNLLQAKAIEIKEKLDVQLTRFQIMERYVKIHEGTRIALQKQRAAQLVWIETLTRTESEQLVSFRNALSVLKTGSEQEHSARLVEGGEILELQNLERILATGNAAAEAVNQLLRRQPEQILKVEQQVALAAKTHMRQRADFDELVQFMKEHYGRDIGSSSFFKDSENAATTA